jgi:malonyl-CoA decarboxylase
VDGLQHRINFLGDVSSRGLGNAFGFMVNYLYKEADIERNHERYVARGDVAASDAVRWLALPAAGSK